MNAIFHNEKALQRNGVARQVTITNVNSNNLADAPNIVASIGTTGRDRIRAGFEAWRAEQAKRNPHVAMVLRELQDGPATQPELLAGLPGSVQVSTRRAIRFLRDSGVIRERDAFPVTGARRVVEKPLRVLELVA